jgi:hypothetical protein
MLLQLSGEVTYAELCLARPSTLTAIEGAEGKLSGLGALAGFGTAGIGSGGGVIVGGKLDYPKEATVYACIDHNARPHKVDQLSPSSTTTTTAATTVPLSSPINVIQDPLQLKQHQLQHPLQHLQQQQQQQQHYPREVVTVRTPLISSQESCV